LYTNKQYPTVTIITACYNSAKTIEQTMQSVADQTYPNIEYIVVDGASTDNTLNIIEGYNTIIAKLITEPDNGIYEAFNKGITAATGDIIYFLNSDDYLFNRTAIEDIALLFAKNEHLSFIYSNVVAFDEKTNYQFVDGKKMTLDHFKRGDMCPHQGIFVKRELFQKYGLFDENYRIAADYEFVIKCFKNEPEESIQYVNQTVAFFRAGGISSNPQTQQEFQREQKEVLYKHFGSIQEFNETHTNINPLFKIWLEVILLQNKGVSQVLRKHGINKIAIFGTRRTGLLLLEDCLKEKYEVQAFLDNNKNMQNKEIKGIPVKAPSWLAENAHEVDAVILSIENSKDIEIINQMKELCHKSVFIYSWKDLVRMSGEE
jgi:glycosyltransferase involved in cell wall biosynthesis